jgi:hypothetical protein
MTWNYRVLKKVHQRGNEENEEEYGIYEVYYKDDGTTPKAQSAGPDRVSAYTLEELREVWSMMGNAFALPILDDATWEESEEHEHSLTRILGKDIELVRIRMSLLSLSRLYKSISVSSSIGSLIYFDLDVSNVGDDAQKRMLKLEGLRDRRREMIRDEHRLARDKLAIREALHAGNQISGVSTLMRDKDMLFREMNALEIYGRESRDVDSLDTIDSTWAALGEVMNSKEYLDISFSQQMVLSAFSREEIEEEQRRGAKTYRELTEIIDRLNNDFKVELFLTEETTRKMGLI